MKLVTAFSAPGLSALLLAGIAWQANAAPPKVEVTMLPPAKYTDVGDGLLQQERNLKDIADFVAKLGTTTLADDQTLSITFLEIDLAGRPKLFHRSSGDYRIMTGEADWPHMKLHWVLHTPGAPDREADAALSDMNYLWGIRNWQADAPLYYDKRMVQAWFKQTFGPPTAGAAAP